MKILVRATNWVGDAVMSIPAIQAIRARWPNAEMVILARAWVAELYREQGLADRLTVLDSSASGAFGAERMAHELRRERFDCAVLLPNAFSAAWLAWRAGARERVGYAREGRSALLTQAISVPQTGEVPAHESYYYLELLHRAGWIDRLPVVEEIRLRIASDARERAESRLRQAGVRSGALRIAVAPGATYGSAKCWAPERFAEIADRLIADSGADVVLFGTASERDIAERIAARMRHRPVNLSGETPIGELPALFASCDLFIGNDSGAMHVAAASGLPVVAIFGPTDLEGTAPVTPRRTLVQQKVSCSPCFLRHCPVDHRCMTRIEVDAVQAAAHASLERSRRV